MPLDPRHFDQWQRVDRLLLCCTPGTAAEPLEPALRLLQHTLPKARLTLLHSASAFPSSLQLPDIQIISVQEWSNHQSIEWLRQQCFDAAIVFTEPLRSPYVLAYLCYLAGIPIRVGQSQEFGGAVLSTCVAPPLEPVSPERYHLHLLQSCGFPVGTEPHQNQAVAASY